MSFRRRNVAVSSPKDSVSTQTTVEGPLPNGIRPSPLDGRLTTSTGTRSLDALLAGYAGLALGTSLLIEESGTTDFGGVLLRYFAAEGVVQGHHVHILGMDEGWGRELPGLTVRAQGASPRSDETSMTGEKMKIAWRYERLGEFGKGRNVVATTYAQPDSGSVVANDYLLDLRESAITILYRSV